MSRSNIIQILFLVFSIGLIFRFGFVMLTNHAQGPKLSPPAIKRGTIFDQNGEILAIETEFFSLTAWKPDIEDPAKIATFLAPALELSEESIYNKITADNGVNFVFLGARKLPDSKTQEIDSIIKKNDLKGLSLQPESKRVYPLEESAAHLIGFTNIDNRGQDGIELTYDNVLSPIIWNNKKTNNGNDIYLTIDAKAQYILEKIMRKAIEQNDPDFIMGLLVEAKTGKIRAYAQEPSYNPNHPGDYPQSLRDNKIATYMYEPGSVFKIFSMASILNNGGIDINTRVDTSNSYNPEDFQRLNVTPITDLNNYGILTPTDIIVNSSNVGMSFLSDTIEKERLFQYIQDLGFGKRLDLPLSGQARGLIQPPKRWSLRSKATISFGQEFSVTALQMIAASTALANNGTPLALQLIERVVSPTNETIQQSEVRKLKPVFTPETAQAVLDMMQQVTERGTARRLKIDGIDIASKSGTAQVYDPKTGLYSTENFLGSLISIFPKEDPEYILYLVMSNPKGQSTYGGYTLSPIMREIILNLIPYYGIDNRVAQHYNMENSLQLPKPRQISQNKTLEDLAQYSKREVLNYVKSINNRTKLNLNLTLLGNGWVVYQYPPPHTPLTPNMDVYIELRPPSAPQEDSPQVETATPPEISPETVDQPPTQPIPQAAPPPSPQQLDDSASPPIISP